MAPTHLQKDEIVSLGTDLYPQISRVVSCCCCTCSNQRGRGESANKLPHTGRHWQAGNVWCDVLWRSAAQCPVAVWHLKESVNVANTSRKKCLCWRFVQHFYVHYIESQPVYKLIISPYCVSMTQYSDDSLHIFLQTLLQPNHHFNQNPQFICFHSSALHFTPLLLDIEWLSFHPWPPLWGN